MVRIFRKKELNSSISRNTDKLPTFQFGNLSYGFCVLNLFSSTGYINRACRAVSEMKTPCSLFWPVYQQQTGLPIGFCSRILNYKDNILLPLISIAKITYVSTAVSGTKVNIVNVFNYEFPTEYYVALCDKYRRYAQKAIHDIRFTYNETGFNLSRHINYENLG